MADKRQEYLSWYTAGLTTEPPQDVLDLLDKFAAKPLPFTLSTNAAGSPMMVPGVHPMAYRARLGVANDTDVDALDTFVDVWADAPFQADYKPMDWNHATVDHLLVAWSALGRLDALIEAVTAVDALHAMAVDHTQNQRAFGHMLEVDAKLYAATGLWKYAAHAGSIIAHLNTKIGWGPIDKGGWPWTILNTKGLQQADHGFCQVTPWMTSRILHGCRLWASLMPGAMGRADFRAVAGSAFQVVRTAFDLLPTSEAGHVADFDPPSGKVHDFKPDGKIDGKAMWIWTMVSILGLWDEQAKLTWLSRDSMRAQDKNAARLHDCSVLIAASRSFGWRGWP